MHSKRGVLPVAFEQGELISRQAEWGGMTIAVEQAPIGANTRPLFEGLPGNSCQCPHWGYLISGKMRVIYDDREELIEAGEVYYLAPGHNTECVEVGEVVEFSPAGQYRKTMDAVAAKMAASER